VLERVRLLEVDVLAVLGGEVDVLEGEADVLVGVGAQLVAALEGGVVAVQLAPVEDARLRVLDGAPAAFREGKWLD